MVWAQKNVKKNMRYTQIWYKGRLYIHCILYKYKGRLSDDGLAWSTSYGGGMCPTNEWSLTCYSLGTTNQQTSYRPKVSKNWCKNHRSQMRDIKIYQPLDNILVLLLHLLVLVALILLVESGPVVSYVTHRKTSDDIPSNMKHVIKMRHSYTMPKREIFWKMQYCFTASCSKDT